KTNLDNGQGYGLEDAGSHAIMPLASPIGSGID
ncbi:MAG: thiazole synthase, partial [Sulfurovum sp.]|nr:thiazole synthase [Sulfurovaceae bacterium]